MAIGSWLWGAYVARTAAGIIIGAATAGGAVAGSMATGGLTSQPIGHFEFCKSSPRECQTVSGDAPAPMTKGLWSLVQSVNASVNHAVRPVSDFDVFGKDEVWSYPAAGVGDCEDYVLEKRRQLNRRGVSFANLLITVVRKTDGEGHAVLTVRTDQGDFILDNLTDKVKSWQETNYRFLKRQSSAHSGRWVSLREDRNMLVGSVVRN